MKRSESNPRLAAKLAMIMDEVDELSHSGSTFEFGSLRSMLGRRGVLILPSVKEHREVPAPSEEGSERVRATVVLELKLEDIDTGEQIVTNWVGRTVAHPDESIDGAILAAMKEFMRTMFLIVPGQPANDVAPTAEAPSHEHPVSAIRRRPQGAPDDSTLASPATSQSSDELVAVSEPAPEPVAEAVAEQAAPVDTVTDEVPEEIVPAPVHTPEAQIDLLDALHVAPAAPEQLQTANEEAANEDVAKAARDEYEYKAWKAANALWRALVSDVVSHEVMDAYESVLEERFGVGSWKDVDASKIREVSLTLKRRARTPAGLKVTSEREEFILHQLPSVPEGSSLDRSRREIARLVREVAPEDVHETFMRVYLERMDADSLAEVPGKSLVALIRKLRKLDASDRRELVFRAVGVADHEAA